jgi:hypothetical protein
LLGALGSASSADTLLTLTGPIAGNTVGPQSDSNPCIIGGTTCQNPDTFSYNQFSPNNDSAYNRYSTAASTPQGHPGVNVPQGTLGTPYTSLQIAQVVNSLALTIAIDVNTTSAASETLLSFEIIQVVPGPDIVLAHYTGPTLIGNINNNGNGYADWTLTGFTFAGLGFNGTEQILFRASWSGAVGGAESFFLLGAGPPAGVDPFCTNGCAVPGPMVGAGLPGLIAACGFLIALARRRRRLSA